MIKQEVRGEERGIELISRWVDAKDELIRGWSRGVALRHTTDIHDDAGKYQE